MPFYARSREDVVVKRGLTRYFTDPEKPPITVVAAYVQSQNLSDRIAFLNQQ